MINTIEKYKTLLFMFAITLGLFWISLKIPYLVDDWSWGGERGLERLSTMFSKYNGRYLGNFLIIWMTRNEVGCAAIMAITSSGIIWLLSKIVSSKKTIILLLTTLLFFTMPLDIARQTVLWRSGFANYMPPVFLILIYIMLIKNIFKDEKPTYLLITPIISFLIAVAAGLFMEHVTIYSVILGVFVIVYTLIRFKRVYAIHINYLLGAIVSAAIMFTNEGYVHVASGQDGYRTIYY